MEHINAADLQANEPPAEYFTGSVSMVAIPRLPEPARMRSVRVTFQPGARTAWHTHPVGQLLIVTEGHGWACTEGGERIDLRPGDVVRFAPGERHWHGASAESTMTHLAFQEEDDGGSSVTWQEHVSDADYLGAQGGS